MFIAKSCWSGSWFLTHHQCWAVVRLLLERISCCCQSPADLGDLVLQDWLLHQQLLHRVDIVMTNSKCGA